MKRLPDILPANMRGLRGYTRFIGYCYPSSPAATYLSNPGFYIGIRKGNTEYVRIATFATFEAAETAMLDDDIMRHLPTYCYSWTAR